VSRLLSHSDGGVSVSVPLCVPVVTTLESSSCPSVPVVLSQDFYFKSLAS
jgi:hypothetical protein